MSGAYIPTPTTSFEQCPPGNHIAYCFEVVDLGTHEDTYEGKTTRRRQIIIGFETPLETMADNRPYVVTQFYTWSMNEKAKLREHLEAWRGVPFGNSDFGPGGFHISKIIGVPAMINIVHSEQGRAKIASISPLPKGTTPPPPLNPKRFVFLDKAEFKMDAFETLSDGLKAKITSSPEWAELRGGSMATSQQQQSAELETPF